MKSYSSILFLFLGSVVFAQPAADGFLRGKGNLVVAPSVTYESFGQYYSKLNNKVAVSRSSIAANLYMAYGITRWLDVQVSAPYIHTKDPLSGFQDFSIYFKGALLDRTNKESENNLKILAAVGYKTPMSQYNTESVNSIGQGDTALDGRLIVQYFLKSGFFAMVQGGYTHRLNVVPSSYSTAFKVGWAKEKYYLDIWYDQQWALGGNDYQMIRDGMVNDDGSPISFRTFGVSYGKIGLSYYRPLGKNNGFSAAGSYILWGRNVGQSFAVSLAYVHTFKFLKN